MALRGGRKLSKTEAAQVQSRMRGDLSEYESTFAELGEGEGYTYEIGEDEKSITERSRWTAVAGRQGVSFRFSSKKDRSTGQTTITVVKGTPTAAPTTGRGRRSS
jgi:hypothetical protein